MENPSLRCVSVNLKQDRLRNKDSETGPLDFPNSGPLDFPKCGPLDFPEGPKGRRRRMRRTRRTLYIYIYIYSYNLHLVVFPPQNVTDDIDFRNGRHRFSEWKNTGKMMASQISLNICKYHKIPGRGFDRSLCPIFFGVELAWTWGHRFCWKFNGFQHNLCPSVVLALN